MFLQIASVVGKVARLAVVRLVWDVGEPHETGPSQVYDRSRNDLAFRLSEPDGLTAPKTRRVSGP
jgi:hypothetical protein